MVDRPARDHLALQLRRLASGRITSDEFDDVVGEFGLNPRSEGECDCGYNLTGLRSSTCPECGQIPSDRALAAIAGFGWCLYDDIRGPHYLRGKDALTKQQRRVVAEAVVFLKSDVAYEYLHQRGQTPLSSKIWMLILIVGCISLAASHWFGNVFMLIALGSLLTLFVWLGLRRFIASISKFKNSAESDTTSDNEAESWPFISSCQKAASIKEPVFLVGHRRVFAPSTTK